MKAEQITGLEQRVAKLSELGGLPPVPVRNDEGSTCCKRKPASRSASRVTSPPTPNSRPSSAGAGVGLKSSITSVRPKASTTWLYKTTVMGNGCSRFR